MHISASTLNDLLHTWGYLAVLFFVMIESTGIPFPGETMLITASVYAGAGHLHIPFVIAAAACGAIMGDNFGYLIGRTGGRSLVVHYGKYIHIDVDKLKVAEQFFDKHGDKTVFLGRFVAVLRAWAAFLAGVNRMRWPVFAAFNAAGGICWAILYGVLGFELGKNLPLLHSVMRDVGIVGVVIFVLFVLVLFILYRRRKAANKQDDQTEERDAAIPGL